MTGGPAAEAERRCCGQLVKVEGWEVAEESTEGAPNSASKQGCLKRTCGVNAVSALIQTKMSLAVRLVVAPLH